MVVVVVMLRRGRRLGSTATIAVFQLLLLEEGKGRRIKALGAR